MINKTTLTAIALLLGALSMSATAQGPQNGAQQNKHHNRTKSDPYVAPRGGNQQRPVIVYPHGRQLAAVPHGNPAPQRSPGNYAFHNLQTSHQQYVNDSQHYTLQIHNTVINNNYYQNPNWGGHWREGYVQRPGLSISFNFGLYAFTPFSRPCVPSPWYYYPGVPAYVPVERVVMVPRYYVDWGIGIPYTYEQGVPWNSYGNRPLNRAVTDIVKIFSEQDMSKIDDLLGENQIAVFAEGKYEYSLSAPDFRSMMLDNAQATQTTNFTITSVRRDDEFAVVQAAHQFQNGDGTSDTVYQQYRLLDTGNQYVVTDFMTSHNPFPGQQGNNF